MNGRFPLALWVGKRTVPPSYHLIHAAVAVHSHSLAGAQALGGAAHAAEPDARLIAPLLMDD